MCVLLCSLTFYNVLLFGRETNIPLKTANGTLTQGILNGGFETGTLTPWRTGGDHLARVHEGSEYVTHSGSYGCIISVYGGVHYNDAWIEQDLRYAVIVSENITSFTCWRKINSANVRVTITYWDDTTTHQNFNAPPQWTMCNITEITPGKRLKKVRFETISDPIAVGGIDDIYMNGTFTLSEDLPGIPGYPIGIILTMTISILVIIYYQKFRKIKSN